MGYFWWTHWHLMDWEHEHCSRWQQEGLFLNFPLHYPHAYLTEVNWSDHSFKDGSNYILFNHKDIFNLLTV